MPALSRRLFLGLIVLAAWTAALPVRAADPPAVPGPVKVPYTAVATTGMVADLVARIGGRSARVVTLMGPGTDPHLYRPTRTDMARLAEADIIFYNGLLLEGKLTQTLDKLAAGGKRVHAVTQRLTEVDLLSEESDAAGKSGVPATDPHVWMNPKLWAEAVETVRLKLTEMDPQGAEGYAARAGELKAELAALDAYAEKVLSSVPERSRVLVTAHDAFNYLARRYGYRVEGVQGISTESEAGVSDIRRIVDLLVRDRVRAVFVESTVSDRNVKALIAGAKAKGHEVVLGGELFSDAMGPEGTYEGTYVGMIDHNVTTIARALGGEAPAGGMNGRLGGKPSQTPAEPAKKE